MGTRGSLGFRESGALVRFSAAALALFLGCPMGTAQVATARLEGVVEDASGAVVPGARVSVVNTRTQSRTETTVSPEGLFAFPSLQPSVYTLSVEAAGFRKAVVSGLELNVGATVSQRVVLEVGEVSESVTVLAGTARVQSSDAQIARTVTLRDNDVLPQLGRGPIALALNSPGIQARPGTALLMTSVNGTRQGSTNSRLDGIDLNDSATPYLGLSTAPFNTDSIEEFRIVTNGGKAEYGRSAGGQIEMITRSGSNAWHGNAFEYHRNTVLNANKFFANKAGLPRPVFIQNVFGGSIGGPVHGNRTFIFGNFQGRRTAQQDVRIRTVLTPEAGAGLFRLRPPGSTVLGEFDIVRNDPLGRGIDPKVAEILDLLPEPNDYAIGDGLNTAGFRFNNTVSSSIGDGNDDEFTARADHSLWNGLRIFARWSWDHPWLIDSMLNNDARFPDQPQATQDARRSAYSIGSDWAINSRLVNELRVGQMVYTWDFIRPARLPGPMLLAKSWTDPLNPAFPNGRVYSMRQITDSLTLVHGKHTLKGGFDWRFTGQRSYSDAGIWPDVSFDNSYGNVPNVGPSGGGAIATSDRGRFERLYNDLLGRMNLVRQTFHSDLEEFQPAGTARRRTYGFREYGQFFQDDWKLHPRFTLNFGLRYEISGVPFEANGSQGTVDKAALISASARLADLTIQRGSRWYDNDLNNFAPRLGFAWDVTGGGKTALRANWGVFYDRLIGAATSSVDANTPGFSATVVRYPNSLSGSDVRVSDGIPALQPPDIPPARLEAKRSMDLYMFRPNLRTGYVQHYSLTIQREILRNTVIEAGFVGTHGAKLFMFLNLNQPRIYDGFLDSFRELQALREQTPASNTLVRIFGSAGAAVSSIGSTNLAEGAVGKVADNLDLNSYVYGRYTQAGLTDFYLRNFPQFNRVIVGGNDGRSYYNSFQLSLRRQTGALKLVANYTFSKSIDSTSAEGNGYDNPVSSPPPIDSFNVRLNRARSDLDFPHAFNSSFVYALPFGEGGVLAGHAPQWLDSVTGGWDLGVLTTWQSGRVVTYLSGRATGPSTASSFVNYEGDRDIGRVMRNGDGVYWLTGQEIERFSYPRAGEIGTGGRNGFRGPRFFNVDVSLMKRFKMTGRHGVLFRAEAYNVFNNANFDAPNLNLSTPSSFGKIPATVGDARVLQMALRYDF